MSIEKLIDSLEIKLMVFDIIANEMKWKFANRFDVPLNDKQKILQSYDEGVEDLISRLKKERSINIKEAPGMAKQIIEFYKSEAIRGE